MIKIPKLPACTDVPSTISPRTGVRHSPLVKHLRASVYGIALLLLSVNSVAELGWVPKQELSEEEQATLPSFCRGMYRPADITPLDSDRIEADADASEMQIGGSMHLEGDVIFRQQDRVLTADQADWQPDERQALFTGNVTLNTPVLSLSGDAATYQEVDGQVALNRAAYSIPARHMRGTAASIETPSDNLLELEDATVTFCEPGRNDWDLAASELTLDQEEGFGTAWHTRLRIREVPILYIPYYRFPIDDRRLTGFLDPKFTVNELGQAEDIQIPFYLNLAPNLDATITPHHILDRGVVWESQLRHKTKWLGDGELNYAYLNKDATEQDERWLINYQQAGRWTPNLQHRWVYNHVSDSDYLNDMNPSAAVDRTTHLPRRGEILFDQGSWHADATIENFQTIDDDITLANRPYRRLPQFNLNYKPQTLNGLRFTQTLQTTRFNRDSEATINNIDQTLSGFSAINGDRLVSDSGAFYPMEWPFGYLTPGAEYRYRSYHLYDTDATVLALDGFDEKPAYGAARYSVDAGLYFDREFDWFGDEYQQTLEPRIYYVRSPYIDNQDLVPNFDTKLTTVTFASLFTGDRFTGGDRLADLNQMSVGLTSRFIRDDGLEQLRASIGRIYYQRDRDVQLTGTNVGEYDLRATSSTLGEVEWNPSESWSVFSTLEWDSYYDYARQRKYGARYEGSNNRMLSVSSTRTQSYSTSTESVSTSTHQLDAGAFWALNDRWALVARQLRDLRKYDTDERKPVSPVLESIAGLEYQSCCWRVQALYRESSSNDSSDVDYTTDKKYGFMLSFQLKGLGNFGSGTDELISDGINGYSRRQYHDF